MFYRQYNVEKLSKKQVVLILLILGDSSFNDFSIFACY